MRKYTIPQNMTIEYLLGDHLGSTSITTDTTGAKVSEMRYKPWGEIRYSWTSGQSTTPAYVLAKYTFTSQYSHMDDPTTAGVTEGFGLLFYVSRLYDPALGRFIQADSIVPGGAQGLDRYAYVNNSPVRYSDPSGHKCVGDADECDFPHGPNPTVPSGPPPLLIFSNDEGQSFTPEEIQVFEAGARDIARALARGINASCNRADRKMGLCGFVSSQEAFYNVFGGPISVKRVADTADSWAMHKDKNADGLYEIWVYSSTSIKEILDHPRLTVHEIGHAFYWVAGGYIDGSSVGERNGFYGPRYQWQFGHDSEGDLGTEIFADMFVGWVYGKWQPDPKRPSGLSINGEKKSAYMDKYMPLMINKAIGR